ncbi:MAG: aminotransferase class I/II-fold pyridoxal phosphate-dependent enzyme, partial [Armatimonadetes bacterium]|nr:aminotransferase class I/II-fold pyridoxal phosphate-dependent enzyme [Armatimonadota bacterium]
PLIGSKEGIAHVFLACVDQGDQVLIPDPGYPVYQVGALMAGGEPNPFPLLTERGFLPDLESISPDLSRKAKLLFLNYPNNPTGASAELSFFQEVVEFAQRYDIIICHDNAYSEVAYDGFLPPSFLQAEGAKEIGIEFGSLSKPYNMTGWRIGYAVGNSTLIKALGTVKNNIDSGAFKAVQEAGILALDTCDEEIRRLNKIYQRRRDLVVRTLQELGLDCRTPKASFYVWARVPSGYTSTSFTAFLLSTCGVIVAPGVGYGSRGEGYFRISITLSEERIGEALERMRNALKGNPCETTKSKA